MKSRLLGLAAFASMALFFGCSSMSPYDYLENWAIREDPIRPFVVPSDVIYVQGELYLNVTNASLMTSYALDEVGRGRFDGLSRVFSPLVANEDDLEEALDWYFKYHHTKGRPFAFIGEGEGGMLLKRYEEANEGRLRRLGLVASFYSESTRQHYVTEDTVKEIRRCVSRARYRSIWGREMPEEEGE